jgi:hypothetical protein
MTDGVASAWAKSCDAGRLMSTRVTASHSSFRIQQSRTNSHVCESQCAGGNAEQPSDEISHPDSPSSATASWVTRGDSSSPRRVAQGRRKQYLRQNSSAGHADITVHDAAQAGEITTAVATKFFRKIKLSYLHSAWFESRIRAKRKCHVAANVRHARERAGSAA